MALNVPNPPDSFVWWWFWLWRWISIGRAYLTVHGGPAPRRVLTRCRPWRRRRRRGSSSNSCCSSLVVAAVMGTLQPAMCAGRGVVVGLVAVT